jgi:hypothetical protein
MGMGLLGKISLDRALAADPRSARDAAQAAGQRHHPIKSMVAWMIGISLWLGVGLASKTAH